MHILYIHQYFTTPNGITGTRSYEFARRWVARGHKVTMLTTTALLVRNDLNNAKGMFFKKFTVEGIQIVAISVPYRQQMRAITKCLSFLGFVLVSSIVVLFMKGFDAVYATSTPLTVGVPALIAKWFRKRLFVFEVRDQWPEVPIELGIIHNKLIIRLLLWLERTIYNNSSAIVACSPGQAESIRNIVGGDKQIMLIPNSCDTDFFRSNIDGAVIREKHGWKNKLVLLHAGAMGKVNSLGFIIDAAVKLKNNPEIQFVLLGGGSQKLLLQNRVNELGLASVEMLSYVPKQELPKYFAAADIGLVIIGNFPIVQHNSANKFFDSLSAAKPVLLNYSGWQREILEGNNAGFGCKLYDVDEFVEKVLYFNSHREVLVEMGKNARWIAEEEFDRNDLAGQALSLLLSVSDNL